MPLTHPVGRKKANRFGLYDMSGNVLEWCEDHWHADYKEAPKDGRAWTEKVEDAHRVTRGGSWYNYDINCRVSGRDVVNADGRDSYIGYRLARY
ncbi:MAG: formylglycine-generating enzyme family protein [Saprospiraceae bacterium]|nr:formylglycine-generating enzyme family protein [Saprospiraceae bacterium]